MSQILINVPDKMHAEIKSRARQDGISVAGYLRHLHVRNMRETERNPKDYVRHQTDWGTPVSGTPLVSVKPSANGFVGERVVISTGSLDDNGLLLCADAGKTVSERLWIDPNTDNVSQYWTDECMTEFAQGLCNVLYNGGD